MGRTYTFDRFPRLLAHRSFTSEQIKAAEEQAVHSILSVQKNLDLAPSPYSAQYQLIVEMLRLLASDDSPLQLPHLAFDFFITEELHWSQTPSAHRQYPLLTSFTADYRTDLQQPVELQLSAEFIRERTRLQLMVLFFPQLISSYDHGLDMLSQHLYRPQYMMHFNTTEKGTYTFQQEPLHLGRPYQENKEKHGEDPQTLFPYWIALETPLRSPRLPKRAPRPISAPYSLVPALR